MTDIQQARAATNAIRRAARNSTRTLDHDEYLEDQARLEQRRRESQARIEALYGPTIHPKRVARPLYA